MQPFPAKSKLQTDWSYGAVEHSCSNRYESRDVRQNFCLIDVHCTLLYKPRGTKIEDTRLTPLCLLRNTSMEDNLALSISHWKSAAMCIILSMNTFIFGEQNNGDMYNWYFVSKHVCYNFYKDFAVFLARNTDILAKFEYSVKYVGGKNSQQLNNKTQISIKWEYPAQTQLKLFHLKTSWYFEVDRNIQTMV